MEADVFSREPNGLIALRITQDEWDELLIVLGGATRATMVERDAERFKRTLRLVNRLNTGNPDFTPYEVLAWEIQP
jgi:flagellar motor component MotA